MSEELRRDGADAAGVVVRRTMKRLQRAGGL